MPLIWRWALFVFAFVSAGWLWWLHVDVPRPHVGLLLTEAPVEAVSKGGSRGASQDPRRGVDPRRGAVGERQSSQSPLLQSRAVASAAESFQFERVIVAPVDPYLVPEHVAVGDVTGDRRNDVVEALSSSAWDDPTASGVVRIHRQNADGTLAAPLELALTAGWSPGGLQLVDLDRDGRLEIVVGTKYEGLTIFRRSASGFQKSSYRMQSLTLNLSAVDADGDGRVDIFAQSWGEGADLFLGDGLGGFREVRHFDTPAIGYNTVEAADFTADGLPDVVLTNGQGWSKVWIYPYMRSSGLGKPIELDLQSILAGPPWGMTVADINRDGRPDLVVTDDGSDILPTGIRIFYRGTGNTFSRNTLLLLGGSFDSPGATAVADLDGNGFPDVVTMLNSYDTMAYFLQGPSGFAEPVKLSTDNNPWTNNFYDDGSFVIADVNSDRCPDVVLAELSSSLRIFYGRNCIVHPPTLSGPHPALRR